MLTLKRLKMMIELDKIYNEDCLQGMKRILDGSVDMILCDLPFGITDCKFDKRLPFEPMWEQFKRVTKFNAAIVLFSKMPFGAELIMSNRKMFRYEWIWEKNLGTGFLNARKMPLVAHENILVFYRALPTYNPQFRQGEPYKRKRRRVSFSQNYHAFNDKPCEYEYECDGRRYPLDVISYKQPFAGGAGDKSHPYTNEGESVLDATIGSGSTAVACINTGRRFIGFETEKKVYDIANKRISKAYEEQGLFKQGMFGK